MALTEIFVNPAIAADSGAGTVGDPYGDLRYAIEQSTFDTTNGTRVNIKSGTAEVLTENLATTLADTGTSVAWVTSETAPLVFQGYTTTAGDGGICEIDGDATYPIFEDTSQNFLVFMDMKIGNVGSNYVLNINDRNVLYNCEIHTSSQQGVYLDVDCFVAKCYFHGLAGASLQGIGNNVFRNNFIKTAGTVGIDMSGNDGWAMHNIISCSGSAVGAWLPNEGYFYNNSVWSNGGTGTGVTTQAVKTGIVFFNNIIAGFSGSGGVGTDFTVGTDSIVRLRANNSYYDNETNHAGSDVEWVAFGNETLSASPFTDPSNDDFSPVDTGSIKEGSFPAFKV